MHSDWAPAVEKERGDSLGEQLISHYLPVLTEYRSDRQSQTQCDTPAFNCGIQGAPDQGMFQIRSRSLQIGHRSRAKGFDLLEAAHHTHVSLPESCIDACLIGRHRYPFREAPEAFDTTAKAKGPDGKMAIKVMSETLAKLCDVVC